MSGFVVYRRFRRRFTGVQCLHAFVNIRNVLYGINEKKKKTTKAVIVLVRITESFAGLQMQGQVAFDIKSCLGRNRKMRSRRRRLEPIKLLVEFQTRLVDCFIGVFCDFLGANDVDESDRLAFKSFAFLMDINDSRGISLI